jgi:hypothetical protein
LSKRNRLQVAQHRGGYVLEYAGIVAGGKSFLLALRDLYKRVPAKHKPIVEKIGKDGKAKGFIDGLYKK